MSELKPCPFCGGEASIENDGLYRWVECLNSKCEASARVFMFINDVGNADYIVAQNWNTRPIEDALNARIAELEAENDRLQDGWFRDETICPDGSLRPKVSDLLNRIAELEAEIDQLTAHSDIERQDDKSPNDTQTSTIVYGKEREE